MEQQPFKPELRLIVQASVPIEDIFDGEELYRQLKEMLRSYSPNITLNGQIFKMLEPCCKDKKINVNTTDDHNTAANRGDVHS